MNEDNVNHVNNTGNTQIIKFTQSLIIISPAYPIKSFYYRCDNRFHLDEVFALCMNTNEIKYGVILISGSIASFHTLSFGNTKNLLQTNCHKSYTINPHIRSQHKTGGQSALRFERLRDQTINYFLTKTFENMKKIWIKDNTLSIKGLVIGGPGLLKNNLRETILNEVGNIIKDIKIFNTDEINENTIIESKIQITQLFDVASDEQTHAKELEQLIKSDSETLDKIIFGEESVVNCVRDYLIETLYIEKGLYDQLNKNYSNELRSLKVKLIKNSIYGQIIGIKYFHFGDFSLDENLYDDN
jgi:peptide subunit release factor 1 (eRF1)